MKPGYWIGGMGLVGAIVGLVIFRLTGWLDVIIGAVIGVVIGAVIYATLKNKPKSGQ